MDWAVLLISEPIKSDGDATKNLLTGAALSARAADLPKPNRAAIDARLAPVTPPRPGP